MESALPEGDEIPTPELPDWLMPVWRAWHRLHLDRPYMGGGMGALLPGRIPWRDVKSWAEYHDMTADGFDFLDFCIREMDSEYLEFSASAAGVPVADTSASVATKTARATAKLEAAG